MQQFFIAKKKTLTQSSMSRWSEQGILLLVCCLLWYFSNNFKASHKWVLLEQLKNPQRSNLKELLPSHDGSWEVMYQTDLKQNINSNWHNSIDANFQCANKVWIYCCMKMMNKKLKFEKGKHVSTLCCQVVMKYWFFNNFSIPSYIIS